MVFRWRARGSVACEYGDVGRMLYVWWRYCSHARRDQLSVGQQCDCMRYIDVICMVVTIGRMQWRSECFGSIGMMVWSVPASAL